MKIHGLTAHQFRAARMVADGDTDKDIAGRLHIGLDGVDALLARIARTWNLDPSKNRRAQITRHFTEYCTKRPAA